MTFGFRALMGFLMSFFLAITMSLFSPVVSGAPLTPEGFATGVVVGTVLGTVILALVPLIPLSMGFAVSCGAREGSLGWFLLKDVLLCTVLVFVISFVLTFMMTGFDAQFANRLLAPMPLIWVICYVVAIQVEPLCMLVASKVLRTPLLQGRPADGGQDEKEALT